MVPCQSKKYVPEIFDHFMREATETNAKLVEDS